MTAEAGGLVRTPVPVAGLRATRLHRPELSQAGTRPLLRAQCPGPADAEAG